MIRTLLTGAALATLASAANATEMAYADLPESIRMAFEAHQPDVHPATAKVEQRMGGTVYRFMDIEHEDILDGNGEIVQCIHPTEMSNLPAAAHELLERVYGPHEIMSVEGVYTQTEDGLIIDYLVTCMHGGETATTLVPGAPMMMSPAE